MFANDSSVTGLILGILIGSLVTSALSFPRVARGFGKLAAVALLGAGGGLLTWGILAMIGSREFEALRCGPITFYSAAQTLGWGVGSLVGGVTALVLSFVAPPK